MTDERAKAYIAGFFDGEGCIYRHYQAGLNVSISQVRPTPLYYIHELYGGRVKKKLSKRSGTSDIFIWTITGNKAKDFLRDILPYLMVKDAEAQEVLDRG